MLTAEKIKQVKKQLRSGYPEGELKKDLQKEGYSEEEIEQLFTPPKHDMRSWYLGSATLLLLFWIMGGSPMVLIFSAIMLSVYLSAKQ